MTDDKMSRTVNSHIQTRWSHFNKQEDQNEWEEDATDEVITFSVNVQAIRAPNNKEGQFHFETARISKWNGE